MALDKTILSIIEEQVENFNQNDVRQIKAQANIPDSINPGAGNTDRGRKCIYEIFIVHKQPSPRRVNALQVSHDDEIPFPATIEFSVTQQDIEKVEVNSPAQLNEKIAKILASEEVARGIQWLLK